MRLCHAAFLISAIGILGCAENSGTIKDSQALEQETVDSALFAPYYRELPSYTNITLSKIKLVKSIKTGELSKLSPVTDVYLLSNNAQVAYTVTPLKSPTNSNQIVIANYEDGLKSAQTLDGLIISQASFEAFLCQRGDYSLILWHPNSKKVDSISVDGTQVSNFMRVQGQSKNLVLGTVWFPNKDSGESKSLLVNIESKTGRWVQTNLEPDTLKFFKMPGKGMMFSSKVTADRKGQEVTISDAEGKRYTIPEPASIADSVLHPSGQFIVLKRAFQGAYSNYSLSVFDIRTREEFKINSGKFFGSVHFSPDGLLMVVNVSEGMLEEYSQELQFYTFE